MFLRGFLRTPGAALWRSNHANRPSQKLQQQRYLANTAATSAVGLNDLEAEKKSYKRIRVPGYFNFASDIILKWASLEKKMKTTPALWWINDHGEEIKWSFSDLNSKSKKVANILVGPCGLRQGGHVLVILSRIPQWWLLNIACIRTGVVLVPCTTLLTHRDIKRRIERSNATCVITDSDNAHKIDEISDSFENLTKVLLSDSSTKRSGWLDFTSLYNEASSDFKDAKTKATDSMMVFFTSGTTGEPKMTEHSHASYGLGHSITGRSWMDLTHNDIHWCLSDTGWAKSAWSNFFSPWYYGSCIFIHDTPKFDPLRTLEILQKYPINVFCAPPTGFRLFIQERTKNLQIPHLRHVISAGEPLNPEVSLEWHEWTGHTIREGYGQTETVLMSASFRCIPNKPGSMGKPPPGMDTQIIDDAGKVVPPGVEGNIALRVSPEKPVGLFTRYLGEPERTQSAFIGDFFVTGDRGHCDEEGYLWFKGRYDDVIISAGYRIGPFEVESALIEHPAVAESAVVASPDPVRGAVVKAFIILTQPFKNRNPAQLKHELREYVKSQTAPYKYPRKIEFVEELPKTISGKIRRVELREKEYHDEHPHTPD